jgi:pantoate--beta-alanine ligase
MNVITSPQELQRTAEDSRLAGKRIAVVPTMGYLHAGHVSLIKLAGTHADLVITTIFVNPAQFAPDEDYSSYPRDPAKDTALAESAGTSILFMPSVEEMYPPGYLTYVEVEKITQILEGKFRPTHFRGVTTVVAKLLHIAKPHVAIFGQKDAQQVAVVRKMARDLNFDLHILVGPIVRESDGLAMSSRNIYLSSKQRTESTVLYGSLKEAERLIGKGEVAGSVITAAMRMLITSRSTAKIDYISIADAGTLEELKSINPGDSVLVSLAARIGGVRLIDNAIVHVPKTRL